MTGYNTNSRRCLGVDPGLANCGWSVVSKNKRGAFKIIASGCIQTDKKANTAVRMKNIYDKISEAIYLYTPDLLSVERVFFNHNPTSCLSTAAVAGICQLSAEQAGIASLSFTPQQVKMACGCGHKASKSTVQTFVSKLTGADINNAHIADSVACAMAGLLKRCSSA